MTAQTQEELLAAHLEQQAIDVYSLSLSLSLSLSHTHTHTLYILNLFAISLKWLISLIMIKILYFVSSISIMLDLFRFYDFASFLIIENDISLYWVLFFNIFKKTQMSKNEINLLL